MTYYVLKLIMKVKAIIMLKVIMAFYYLWIVKGPLLFNHIILEGYNTN